jgi:ribonuclease PH
MATMRHDGRMADRHRPLGFELGYQRAAAGSALVTLGATRVLCAAAISEVVPRWMRGSGRGWVTAEYSMLPSSSGERVRRERRGAGGRTMEIQRLIGRSLRAVTNLDLLGERTVTVDCDVIDADGGTRTASITGAALALHRALAGLKLKEHPMSGLVSAVSVGVVGGEPLLDLDYKEDSSAAVDMNVVMDEEGKFIEVQGTGEEYSFSREQLDRLLDLAAGGCLVFAAMQREALGL